MGNKTNKTNKTKMDKGAKRGQISTEDLKKSLTDAQVKVADGLVEQHPKKVLQYAVRIASQRTVVAINTREQALIDALPATQRDAFRKQILAAKQAKVAAA